MMLQVALTCFFLYAFPSPDLNTVCTYLIVASTASSIFEFILTYTLYVIDRKKALNVRAISEDNYLRKILRIAFPVAITSYVRSGLSTLKQFLIPFSLAKHPSSANKALSQYGLINGMTMPILMFPCIIIASCASLLIPEFARYNIKKDYTRMNQVIEFIFKLTSFFSICIIGIFLTFTEEICYLIYNNLEISEFLVLLSPLVILIYLDKTIDAMLRGLDKQVGVMICNIIDLLSTTLLIYTIVPIYGIYGYIAIIAISEILNFTISLIQLYKATKFKFDYVSYVIVPFLLVIATKLLFDAIDNYIEYEVRFVIIKILIFIGVYVFLLASFNIIRFIKERKVIVIKWKRYLK